MAAILKKRALAEYCHRVEEEFPRPAKRLLIVKRNKPTEQWDFDLKNLDTHLPVTVLMANLLNLYQSLPAPTEFRGELVKKLTELLSLADRDVSDDIVHNFHVDTLVVKVLSLLGQLTMTQESQFVVERITNFGSTKRSPKVIGHSIHIASTIINKNGISGRLFDQVFHFITCHFDSHNYMIKVKCVEGAGMLCPVDSGTQQSTYVKSLVKHTLDQDQRVRTASFVALLKLLERGVSFPAELYDKVSAALKDDFQCAREAALCLVKALAEKDRERLVMSLENEDEIRLVDDAFTQICHCVNDVSLRVRTLAVSLLGSLEGVSSHYLLQTLDKKLMSNMRRKTSAHERARVMVTSGNWSSGRRWADDSPREFIDPQSAEVILNGSFGAFVHGLEDEFLEVRSASLDAICKLSEGNRPFATQCLDFLVDMFNDEIEEVRLKAIQVLQNIAHYTRLRPDQLDEILHAMKDSSLEIRESLHTLLGSCKLTTTSCITSCSQALFNNLKTYPQDKRSIQRCFKQIGTNHAELVSALVPQLLLIHPYFDGKFPNLQQPHYICKLIMVLNAGVMCATMLPILQESTLRHYVFLRETMPHLVPQIPEFCKGSIFSREIVTTNTSKFFTDSLLRLSLAEQSPYPTRLSIYQVIYCDFVKLSNIDPSLRAASNFASLYIQCMEIFTKIFANKDCFNTQQPSLKVNVAQLLRNTLKLRYMFSNMSAIEEASVRCLRIKSLALQLVYVVHRSTGSALGLCDNFLEHTLAFNKFLTSTNLQPDPFIADVVKELSLLEEPRPGAVARALKPLLLTHSGPVLKAFQNPASIKMCSAIINEPTGDREIIYKFNSGLIVSVHFDAEIIDVPDLNDLRIRITYPDLTSVQVIPCKNDIKACGNGSYRVLTNVLLSSQMWSEASQVSISLVLDSSEQEFLAGRKHVSRQEDTATTVQLCQPVKISVWPKPIRKGL